MVFDTRFIPVMGIKIKSAFNNARKSNVGFPSCEIMKKVYKKANVKNLDKKIEDKKKQLDELQNNVATLEENMVEKLQQSTELYTNSKLSMEQTMDQNLDEHMKANDELVKSQKTYNKEIKDISKQINNENKKIEKVQNKLSVFEQLKKESEQQNSIEESTEEEKTTVDDFKKEEKRQSDAFVGLETNVKEDQEITVDPIEEMKNSFSTFIEQMSEEREKYQIENKDLKSENKQLIEALTEAEQIVREVEKSAQSKVQEANRIITTEKNEIKKLMSERDELKQTISNLETENETIKQKNQELEQEIETYKIENQNMLQEISKLKEKQATMDEKFEIMEKQFLSIRSVLSEMQSPRQDNIGNVEGHSPYTK